MPLSTDKKTLDLSNALIEQLQAASGGKHAGFRAAHARGIMVTGTFEASPEAKTLTTAPQFNNESTPITVRFSNSTGVPKMSDTDPNANPRGLGLRFDLGDHVHTDIIAHSTPFFPTRTAQGFLEFMKAAAASPPGTPSPSPIEKFLGANPTALAFVQAEKLPPTSFAKEAYYSVSAFKFIDASGKETYFRYRVLPDAGEENVGATELKEKNDSYLFDELPKHLAAGNTTFTLKAQIAEEGDAVDDATVHWPASRKLVTLGTVKLEKIVPDQENAQKKIIYDPIPRVKGIEPSADPLLDVRANVYLISGRQHRAA